MEEAIEQTEQERITDSTNKPIEEESTMEKQEFGAAKMGLEYIKFMRNSFRTWMESATLIQGQSERLLNLMVKQSEAGYEEWKNVIREGADNYKKGREQFQSTVEENLAKMEGFLSKKE